MDVLSRKCSEGESYQSRINEIDYPEGEERGEEERESNEGILFYRTKGDTWVWGKKREFPISVSIAI